MRESVSNASDVTSIIKYQKNNQASGDELSILIYMMSSRAVAGASFRLEDLGDGIRFEGLRYQRFCCHASKNVNIETATTTEA